MMLRVVLGNEMTKNPCFSRVFVDFQGVKTIVNLLEVGGIERGHFRNFVRVTPLRFNSMNDSKFQLLFGFIWSGKRKVFFTQVGTNLAQVFVWVG